MNEIILAQIASRVIVTIIAMGIYVFLFAPVIICLIRIAGYFRNTGKEQKLIRIELGKVAEEVHQLRHELKDGKDGNTPIVD